MPATSNVNAGDHLLAGARWHNRRTAAAPPGGGAQDLALEHLRSGELSDRLACLFHRPRRRLPDHA